MSAASVAGMHCGACGAQTAPPQPVCPKCGKDDQLQARAIPGEGRLYSFTIVRVPPEGLEGDAPYALGIVELAGGARITARVEIPEVPPPEVPREARADSGNARAEKGLNDAFDGLEIGGKVKLSREEKGVYFFTPAA